MSLLQEILALVLAPTLIVGAAAWVLRAFFQQGLERDIERFKASLRSEQDTAQANLNATLQARLFEHQTRFSGVYQKQAEVLGKTYELLFDPYEHIREFVHPLDTVEPTPEQVKSIIDMFNSLAGYYHKNRIYLPESICEKMDAVLGEMKSALNKNLIARRHSSARSLEMWDESWKAMQNDVPPLMKQLEQEFRKSIALDGFEAGSA